MKKLLVIISIVIVVLALTGWLTSVAYGQDNDTQPQSLISVTPADPATAPTAKFYGQIIGSVTPGDLFFIDANATTQDITLSLSVTNADVLAHHLKYLTLKVTIYVADANGQWVKPQTNDSQPTDAYITLQNSPVNFTLPGGANYKMMVSSGCFYCLSTTGGDANSLAPAFYLDASPM